MTSSKKKPFYEISAKYPQIVCWTKCKIKRSDLFGDGKRLTISKRVVQRDVTKDILILDIKIALFTQIEAFDKQVHLKQRNEARKRVSVLGKRHRKWLSPRQQGSARSIRVHERARQLEPAGQEPVIRLSGFLYLFFFSFLFLVIIYPFLLGISLQIT